MIPKIIHYCWLSNEPYPEKIEACMASWKKFLPDYEFKLWNFSCFDIESSRWVKTAFYAGKYAFAADYIRIHALYHYGGIYLDCDVEVLKSFNDLLHLPYFIGQEKSDFKIEAATIGFEKGHPLLKYMLEYYQDRPFFVKRKGKNYDQNFDLEVMPAVFLRLINENFRLKEIQRIADFDFDKDVISIFPEDYFSPKKWDTGEMIVTPRTYSIHHFSGTWLKKSKAKIRHFRWLRFLGFFMKKYRM